MSRIIQPLLKKVVASWRPSRLYLAAGMPRSGSTWLYNAVRLLLQSILGKSNSLASGWVGDSPQLPNRPTTLLKLHDFDDHRSCRAYLIFYSYRDLRDALASSYRKFRTPPTLELARHWIAQDTLWREVATFTMRYETMMAAPADVIHELATILHAQEHVADILKQLQALPPTSVTSYDSSTLLHPNHVTDGRHGTWTRWLMPDFVRALEQEFAKWFIDNGYSRTSTPSSDTT